VDLVVRGGTVVNAGWRAAADIFVAQGHVVALAEPGAELPAGSRGAQVIDAAGLLVLPGGVDPHCHVGFTSGAYTSLDDYSEATKAAIFGGTTTIVDFAIPRPGQVPADVAYAQRAKATQGFCDSALHACVVEWDDSVPAQLESLVADGIVTVKMFTTYRDETMANADTILRVADQLGRLGGMPYVHCEANHIIEDTQERCATHGRIGAAHHHDTRPELAEVAAVAEVLAIAESVSAPVYLVHQSTAGAVDLVAKARRRGVPAFAEAVIHHLVLDDREYATSHPERFVCCPPLRSRDTVAALQQRLLTGHVATVGSDHCCYDTAQKESSREDVRSMPNGLPGVETRMPVLYSEFVVQRGLAVERFVELTSSNPARLNGIYPRKGAVLPGSDADMVLWDPTASREVEAATMHMATDFTPFEGRLVTGWPRSVIVGGQVVMSDGKFLAGSPSGRSIRAGALDLGQPQGNLPKQNAQR
jgi:dihydropyrimidinase